MAYNEYLADRIRNAMSDANSAFEEKKMMGGLTFMVKNKMCVGVVKDELMARIGPDAYEEALSAPGVRKMDFTGRPMKGYVFINAEGMDTEQQLAHWLSLALKFNTVLTS
jgi:TfoX/Sxy family transcriptional regulator of competence genes